MVRTDVSSVKYMARVLGVSRQAVYDLINAGKMPYVERDASGRLTASIADLMQHKIRRENGER